MTWKELLLETIKKLMIIFTFKCMRNTCLTSSCCDTTIVLSPDTTQNEYYISPKMKQRRHSI